MDPRLLDGFDAEIQDHISRETEENIARGLSPKAARAAALRQFGSLALTREDVRAVWRPVWLDQLQQDVRWGLRLSLRQRTFSIAVILSLAIGIAGSAVILALLDGFVLHPFALPEPDRVVTVGATFPTLSRPESFVEVLSPAEYVDLTRAESIQQWLAFDIGNRNISGGDHAERVFTGLALNDPFAPFNVRPAFGRGFTADELVTGGPAVAIISHRLWRSRFISDPEMIGRVIRVDSRPTVVVGVMPPELLILGIDLWIPWGNGTTGSSRSARQFTLIGRLTPGSTIQQANQELATIASTVAADHGSAFREYEGWRLRAVTWSEAMTRESRPAATVLFAAVALLMLLACANVSSLLLAQATSRRNELLLRLATGASTFRVIRQFITEVTMLTIVGTLLGLVIAAPTLDVVLRLVPAELNRIDLSASLNARVLIWAAGLTLACIVVSTAVPLFAFLHSSRARSSVHTRNTTPTRLSNRLRHGLTLIEIALAVTLMCGAGLLARSMLNLERVDPGFDPASVLTMRLTLPRATYQGERIERFFEQLETSVQELPGVRAVGVTSQFPPNTNIRSQFQPDDTASATTLPSAAVTVVDRQFFNAIGMRMIGGRGFEATDRADAPDVVIVNETLARMYFPGATAVGRTLRVGPPNRLSSPLQVVGVVSDTRNQGIREATFPELFIPIAQQAVNNQLFLIVRTTGDIATLVEGVRSGVARLDPDQPVYAIQTLEQSLADASFRERASMAVLQTFAVVGLILAAVGTYGVMAYNVASRTSEFAIRMCLGADKRTIWKSVLGQGARLIVGGVVAGLVAAALLAQGARGLLFGVAPFDPVIFGAVAAVVIAVGITACLIPTRRAMLTDPGMALRSQI